MAFSRFTQALAALLPQGFAWPRDPASVWMRVLSGVAALFEEHHDWVQQATREWLPHATHTRLEEWEEATGLPDPCFGPTQTYAARQARLVARLRGPSGAYDDSSPAAPGAMTALIGTLGYVATVQHNTRFRCHRDRCGGRLGRTDGVLHLFIAGVTSQPLRVGAGRAGARLITRPPEIGEMTCALEHFLPARFELDVIFT